jgi:hypothetical protein
MNTEYELTLDRPLSPINDQDLIEFRDLIRERLQAFNSENLTKGDEIMVQTSEGNLWYEVVGRFFIDRGENRILKTIQLRKI